jgi:chromosomal replication initiator protein
LGALGAQLRRRIGASAFRSWFGETAIGGIEHDGGKAMAVLIAPSNFIRDWIVTHHERDLIACWQAVEPGIERVEVIIRERPG